MGMLLSYGWLKLGPLPPAEIDFGLRLGSDWDNMVWDERVSVADRVGSNGT